MKCKMAMWSSLDSTFKLFLFLIIFSGVTVPFLFGNKVISSNVTSPMVEKTKIRSTGSTSMSHIISVLADDFMSIYPNYTYEKSETGSGSAPFLVKSGDADIGDMSRYLKENEQFAGFKTNCIALDGIVIVLNDKNPIDDLSIQNLRDIFSKKINDWSEISDKFSGKIITVGREDASGTREGFESGLNINNSVYDIILSESGDISTKIANEERAIGYISMASVSKNIHSVKIDGIECNFSNIKNQIYPLTRPFLQVYSEYDQSNPLIKIIDNVSMDSLGRDSLCNECRKKDYEFKIIEKWNEYLTSDRAKELIKKENLVYV